MSNEEQTVVVQRRCLRASREIQTGEIFTREMIAMLRPATPGAIMPYEIDRVLGTKAITAIPDGKELRWVDLAE
jgi:sialic acid synthase SpsE